MAAQVGGAAMGDHYAALAARGRIKKPKPPALPPEATHVWNAFALLHRSRGCEGPTGLPPLTYGEIESFMRVTQTPLTPWEVDAVRALDDAYLAPEQRPPQ